MTTPWPVAQTNVQLYQQLLGRGVPPADIARARAAYELAMTLHSARFRPNGRPFLSHIVGTASILTSLGVRTDVVITGLLHGAYLQGDFGDGDRSMTPEKRERVRTIVGDAVEALVADYSTLGWGVDVLERVDAGFDALDERGRDVLLVRLANELDDHLDDGALYHANGRERSADFDRDAHRLAALARRLGEPHLADALEAVVERHERANVPDALRGPNRASFDVHPGSLETRFALRRARFVRRVRAALERRIGRIGGRLGLRSAGDEDQ